MKMIRDIRLFYGVLCMASAISIFACSGQNDRKTPDGARIDNVSQDASNLPVISFDTLYHDFGTIIEGEMVVCYFDYVNSGNADLVLTSVDATCGCTTPDWSSEPLTAGEKAHLKIIFDATGRNGAQRKVVSVMSNASNSVVRLTLTANVNNSV